jgi:hypothetical protein
MESSNMNRQIMISNFSITLDDIEKSLKFRRECYTPQKDIHELIISTKINLPSELHADIMEVIYDEDMESYIDEMERSGRIISRMVGEYIHDFDLLKDEYDIGESSLEEFEDAFVHRMGKGYCYLMTVPAWKRLDMFKTLYAWPTVAETLAYLDDCIDMKIKLHTWNDDRWDCHFDYDTLSVDHRMVMRAGCKNCGMYSTVNKYSYDDKRNHVMNSSKGCRELDIVLWSHHEVYTKRVGSSFFSLGRKKGNANSRSNRPKSGSKQITNSEDHENKQLLQFKKSVKGDGIEPDMSRELYSVPKPSEVETMVDHLANHKVGDIFPYVAVMGNEEETKDSRMARLRSLKSAYGKSNRPEMRINGVVLDELDGTIQVQHLKDYVDTSILTRVENRQNKKFRPLTESSFKKPYICLTRITGEYVPLMSSTADFTDLYFTLEDGRKLEHATIVQSGKIPSNQNGIFELSCDYCISSKDIDQLSLKYFLARPVMKEGFQWGSVSLTIRLSESDTPFMLPKVEAMAAVRAPFTTFEERTKDPDHTDVVFTSGQVPRIREMYKTGDIADIDEPKTERMKISSYSKSTLRGTVKGESGPSHLGEQDGWEHLSGMRKPLMPLGEASVSANSDGEPDIDVNMTTKEQYEAHQEELRRAMYVEKDEIREPYSVSDATSSRPMSPEDESGSTPKSIMKKKARIADVMEESPDTKNVFIYN